jgi:hypothetical protein
MLEDFRSPGSSRPLKKNSVLEPTAIVAPETGDTWRISVIERPADAVSDYRIEWPPVELQRI